MALTPTHEAALIARAQAGDEQAATDLLEAHGPMLSALVARFPHRASMDRDDLLQVATLAFWETIMAFDPGRGVRLSTPALQASKYAIAAAMGEAEALPIPGRTLRRYRAAWASTEDYDEAMALATSGEHPMAADTFAAVHATVTGTVSMDSVGSKGGEAALGTFRTVREKSLHEVLPDDAPDFESLEDRRRAWALIEYLPEEHARILALAYGLEEDEPLIDSEIATRLGMSRATVQRRRAEAVEYLSTATASGPTPSA